MRKALWIPIVPAILGVLVLAFILALLLVKFLWSWTVPDLFPGAVTAGLVAESISWLTSLKVAIFVAVMAAISGVNRGSR